jgi:hypothetical protein
VEPLQHKCPRTKRFLTRTDAQLEADMSEWPMEVYQCEHCKNWHVRPVRKPDKIGFISGK